MILWRMPGETTQKTGAITIIEKLRNRKYRTNVFKAMLTQSIRQSEFVVCVFVGTRFVCTPIVFDNLNSIIAIGRKTIVNNETTTDVAAAVGDKC